MDTVLLKRESRKKLKENYIEIISAMVILYALGILMVAVSDMMNIPLLSTLMGLVVSSFVIMGVITMVMKISKGKKTSLDDLFSKSYLFFKTFVLTFLVCMIVGIFMFFLGVALYGLYTSSGLWGICSSWVVTFLICLGIVLSMSLLVFTAYVTLSLSLVYFIYYDNPEMKIIDIIKQSYNLMDGRKLELFIMLFSFMGWFILGIFTLGILYLWLVPYVLVTMASYYNSVKPKAKRGRPKKKVD